MGEFLITSEVSALLRHANDMACRRHHECITPDDMLLAILSFPNSARMVLERLHVDTDQLAADLSFQVMDGATPRESMEHLPQSLQAKKVLENAIEHTHTAGRPHQIYPEDLLAGILQLEGGLARDLLVRHGVSAEGIVAARSTPPS